MTNWLVEFLPWFNFALSMILLVLLLLQRKDRQADREGETKRQAEWNHWRYDELDPCVQRMTERLFKLEGVLLGINGADGLRADVKKLIEQRAQDSVALRDLQIQQKLLLGILADTSANEELKRRLKALEIAPSGFVVNPP